MATAPTSETSARTASEAIAEHLRSQIATGALRPGQMLPAEWILLERYGVARPTMRGALRILESDGLISIERGARGGARIVSPELAPLARRVGLHLQLRDTDLRELIEAQATLQLGAIASAATARTEGDLDRLRLAAARGAEAKTIEEFVAAVETFGRAVLEASHNRALSLYAELTGELLRQRLGAYASESGISLDRVAGLMRWCADQFGHLVELIEASDAASAERFWREFLQRAGAAPATEPSPFELYRARPPDR